MPKVTGPLFSLAASGSIGKALTFRHTARGAVVHKTPQPATAPTAAQRAERASMRAAAAAWAGLSANDRAIWNHNSHPSRRSGWMDFFLEWKAQQIPAGGAPQIPSHFIGVPTAVEPPPRPHGRELGALHARGFATASLHSVLRTADRGALRTHGARARPRRP